MKVDLLVAVKVGLSVGLKVVWMVDQMAGWKELLMVG